MLPHYNIEDEDRISSPNEQLRFLVVFSEEVIDGHLGVNDRREDFAFQTPFGQLGELSIGGIEPRTSGWRKVKAEARMPPEPFHDLRMFLRCVLVRDLVDDLSCQDALFDCIQYGLPLAVAMHAKPRSTLPSKTSSFRDVCNRGHSASAPLHVQAGLSAVERLYLRLLINGQYHGMRRNSSTRPVSPREKQRNKSCLPISKDTIIVSGSTLQSATPRQSKLSEKALKSGFR